MDAHALVGGDFVDLHALVAVSILVVVTGMIFGFTSVIAAAANELLGESKSSTIVFALLWSTADNFATARVDGDSFEFGWLTDDLFWAWRWSDDSLDEARTIKAAPLLVALVWLVNIPFLSNGLWLTVVDAEASSSRGTWWGSAGVLDALPDLAASVEEWLWWRDLDSFATWWATDLFWAALWALDALSVSATSAWSSLVGWEGLEHWWTSWDFLLWIVVVTTWWLWLAWGAWATFSSEAASYEGDAFIDFVLEAWVEESFRAHIVAVDTSDVVNVSVEAITATDGTDFWELESTMFLVDNGLDLVPVISLGSELTLVVNTVFAYWWGTSAG